MTGMKIECVDYDELSHYCPKKRICPMCSIAIPDVDKYKHPDSGCKLSGYMAIRRGIITRWQKEESS